MSEVSSLQIDQSNLPLVASSILASTGVVGFELDAGANAGVTLKTCVFPATEIALNAYTTTGHRFSVTHLPFYSADLVIEGALDKSTPDGLTEIGRQRMGLYGPTQLTSNLRPDPQSGLCRGISCFVPPDTAEKIMAQSGLRLSDAPGAILADVSAAATRSFQDLLAYAYQEFFERGVDHVSPGRARLFEALMADHLAELFEAYGYAVAEDSRVPASLKAVLAAEDIIKRRFAASISVQSVADDIGTSSRSLQRAFKVHRGISPSLFLSTLRLEAARSRLLRARPGETVTSIAHDVGIWHLGRFAARYQRVYGETPMETLKKV